MDSNTNVSAGGDTVWVASGSNLPSSIVGQSFHIKDDDDTYGGTPLRLPDTSILATQFARAYVTIQSHYEWYDRTVPFDDHVTDTEFQATVLSQRNLTNGGDQGFWQVQMLTAFQGDYDEDYDPNSWVTDTPASGEAYQQANVPYYNVGAWYLEIIREFPGNPPEARVVAHEIGHQFGCDHSEGQLMGPSATSDNFTEASLAVIRNALTP